MQVAASGASGFIAPLQSRFNELYGHILERYRYPLIQLPFKKAKEFLLVNLVASDVQLGVAKGAESELVQRGASR